MKSMLIITIAVFLVGCGSSSSSTNTTSTDITVERGPVIGAYVVDDDGKRAYNLENGQYRFQSIPSYPITAYGGYIDVNRDGIIDENDTALNIPLSLSKQTGHKLTILTTLAQNDELKNEILSTYEISEDELYNLTPSQSLIIAAISDIVFKYCIQNDVTVDEITLITLQSLENEIKILISNGELSNDELIDIVTQNEIDLVSELNINLNESDIVEIQNDINQSGTHSQNPTSMIDSFPEYELTSEQKEDLIFMYQEEKMARDVYLKMYEKWNLKIFTNIASAEQVHMDSVRVLLEKYDLEIPVLSDIIGEFDLLELQELYDTLVALGDVSSNEAIKVGILVEETDIADLETKIVDTPDDIKMVYQSLLNGSYNHLNAFNRQVR